MKRTYILLILLASCFAAMAQVPGYMGKRAVAGYGLYMHPAFGSMVNGYSTKLLDTQHELFIEYAVAKGISLGLSARLYRFVNTNMDNVAIARPNMSQDQPWPEGTYTIKGRNFQFYAKFFKDSYLAPWGRYFITGFALNRYKTQYDPDEMRVPVSVYLSPSLSSPSYVEDFGPTTQHYWRPDFFFGTGHARIIADKIMIDYGYLINAYALTRGMINVLDGTSYFNMTTQDYIRLTSDKRVNAINGFNIYVKVGYLF